MTNADIGLTIALDTDPLKKSVGVAQKSLSGLSNFAKGAFVVGIGAATVGIAGLVAGLGASVKAAMDAEEGQAALSAVLESTGGKAGVTAEMANELASSLQNVTKFEDDAILSGESLLLTFTNIGADIFPMATETMLNMSQALGQDLKSSAVQLGKALNDPIKGMTALSRVGVSFTEEQKEQIRVLQESGDLMGAQTIILKELETEFGGAARAAGETFAGKLTILQNKFGDIQEKIGGALIPILTTLATKMIDVLDSPAVQNFANQIGNLFEILASGDDLASGVSEVLGNLFGPQVQAMAFEFVKLIEGKLIPAIREFAAVTIERIGTTWRAIQPHLQNLKHWLDTEGIQALNVFFRKVREMEGIKNEWVEILQEMHDAATMAFKGITGDAKSELPKLSDIIEGVGRSIIGVTSIILDVWRGMWGSAERLIHGDLIGFGQVFSNTIRETLEDFLSIWGIKLNELEALILAKINEILGNFGLGPIGGTGGFGAGAASSFAGGGSSSNIGAVNISFTGGAPSTRAEAEYSAQLIMDALHARGLG